MKTTASKTAGWKKLCMHFDHKELASISIIPVPAQNAWKFIRGESEGAQFGYRIALTNAPPGKIFYQNCSRQNWEPSLFKHVVYIY